tara:strand:+ start:217 stop:408 length:192 start_codon:yes stop_codon:yes gene_type:complete
VILTSENVVAFVLTCITFLCAFASLREAFFYAGANAGIVMGGWGWYVVKRENDHFVYKESIDV